MKVRVLLNIGSVEEELPHLKEGDHDVDEEVGAELIRRGWAEPIASEKEPVVMAVPKASSVQQGPPRASSRGSRFGKPKDVEIVKADDDETSK